MLINVAVSGRVDKILASSLPQYSRAALSKLFDLNLVKLNGVSVKPGHKIREGSVIDADISSLEGKQDVVDLPIVYEDGNVIVVNKPAGIISHARGKYWYEPSVASFIRSKIANASGERAGIVHRLDRATSGLMICAKNEATTKFLQKQFSDRKVIKAYIAVLENQPKDAKAIIEAPIERNPNKPSTFRVGPNGKPSVTAYTVIKKVEKGWLTEFNPKTGRTHQLRVHAKYINCPIVGDDLYGSSSDRLYLHAYKLVLDIPEKGISTFESPVPEGFTI